MFTTSGCSLHQDVHYIRVFTTSGCSLHQGVHYIRVFTTSGCSLHQGVHYIRVFTTSGCSLRQSVHYIRVFTTSGCSLHQGSFTIEYIGVHSKVYVCYIREFIVSRVHYSEARLYCGLTCRDDAKKTWPPIQ